MLTCAIKSQMEHVVAIMPTDYHQSDWEVVGLRVAILLTTIDSLSTVCAIFSMKRSGLVVDIHFKVQGRLLQFCCLYKRLL